MFRAPKISDRHLGGMFSTQPIWCTSSFDMCLTWGSILDHDETPYYFSSIRPGLLSFVSKYWPSSLCSAYSLAVGSSHIIYLTNEDTYTWFVTSKLTEQFGIDGRLCMLYMDMQLEVHFIPTFYYSVGKLLLIPWLEGVFPCSMLSSTLASPVV